MRSIQGIPFLRIILAFLIGIIIYKIEDSLSPFFFAVVFMLCLLGIFSFTKFSFQKRLAFAWVNGLLLHVLFICVGFLISFFHNIENSVLWYKYHLKENSRVQAKIITALKETEKTYKAEANIIHVYDNEKKIKTKGTAILYFTKDKNAHQLSAGDEIIFVNTLNPIISKGNPGEFDYAAFTRNRGIYDQAFLKESEWRKLKKTASFFVNPFPAWHEKIKNIISQNIVDTNAKGIALALITGYRNDIDKEVYNQYTKTGLVHLLAISGLHMGISYGSTVWFLGFLPFFKKRKKILIIVSLTVMWLFALITTFPPSVQRASVMFTFLGVGQIRSQKIPSVNFLFASAFALLLFQPHLLFEVGFQLSYAAVLGILLFFIPLRNLYFPTNKVSKFFWEIMCLSLSAQIFTFPIALYYFHQFPLLFLITNLVAIPLVTLIIYGEILLIIFSLIPVVSQGFGWLVSKIILGLNWFINSTAALPFVSIQNISINLVQCFLLLAAMLCLAFWFSAKRKIFAPIGLGCFIFFLAISIFQKSSQLQQKNIVVYSAPEPYLEILSGDRFYTKDTLPHLQVENFEQYTIAPSHLKLGIHSQMQCADYWHSTPHYDVMLLNNKRILRLGQTNKLKTNELLHVDYLILSDKWLKNAKDLFVYFNPQEIIIDGNIPLWKIEDLKSQLRGVDLPIHYVSTQGAKIIEL